jgi:hypothetical protein
MSDYVHKVKDPMADDNRDGSGARGFRAPQDNYGSFNTRTTESDPNQYNSSSRNPSSSMGSNNPYGSRPHSDPDTYGSTEMGGDDSTRATSAGSGNMNAGPHDSKLANKMDPRVDSDMGKPS